MIQIIRQHLRVLSIAILAVAFSVASLSPTLAAPKKSKNAELLEVDNSKSYTLPYALVVLGVTLGVILVARPTMRSDQAKKRKDEEEDD